MGRDQEQMKKDPCIINSKTKDTKPPENEKVEHKTEG